MFSNKCSRIYPLKLLNKFPKINLKQYSSATTKLKPSDVITVNQKEFKTDNWSNVTPKILSFIDRNIYLQHNHPLSLIRQRINEYFYKSFTNRRGNPVFSIHDNLSPVVSIEQNFDNLLIPKTHPSRAKSDCYYLNSNYLLRAHTTAHQVDFVQSGLDSFLIVGEVYRRDEIDATHYPVFHQIDAVHLQGKEDLFPNHENLEIFESKQYQDAHKGVTGNEKQPCHTLEAVKLMEHSLKTTLVGLAKHLFGENIQHRWVEEYFPFTQPSWELEIFYNNAWMEVLGCGIMQNRILQKAGVDNKIGWAFGLGLERLAMCFYQIPDIRLFWSNDTGFLHQFNVKNIHEKVTYKPISMYPQCSNDISFWLPSDGFNSNDFYDLVRSCAGDIVEQVSLIDDFRNPKTGAVSHCYKITYRHMERTLTQQEVNEIHKKIEESATLELGVKIR